MAKLVQLIIEGIQLPQTSRDKYSCDVEMRHAYLEHSQAKEAGDISLSENNFLSIPEYIDTADHILSVEIY